MGFKCGIVGLPNAGKSTIFNALTKGHAATAVYPFTTIDANVGIVNVPDGRLDRLAEIVPHDKTAPTTIEFVDVAGLVKGAAEGEGLGNQFLGKIMEMDAVAHVVRCFERGDVTHVAGSIDPARDIEIVKRELLQKEIEKKAMYIANINESDINKKDNPFLKILEDCAKDAGAQVIAICGKIEEELAQLEESERVEFMKEMGIKSSALPEIIKAGYRLLGLITFFTTDSRQLRAWTVPEGATAPDAAGKIHTDFEKGFIRAEVVGYDDFVSCGSEAKAREAGLLRTEGKDYQVKDGDVIHFKFQPSQKG